MMTSVIVLCAIARAGRQWRVLGLNTVMLLLAWGLYALGAPAAHAQQTPAQPELSVVQPDKLRLQLGKSAVIGQPLANVLVSYLGPASEVRGLRASLELVGDVGDARATLQQDAATFDVNGEAQFSRVVFDSEEPGKIRVVVAVNGVKTATPVEVILKEPTGIGIKWTSVPVLKAGARSSSVLVLSVVNQDDHPLPGQHVTAEIDGRYAGSGTSQADGRATLLLLAPAIRAGTHQLLVTTESGAAKEATVTVEVGAPRHVDLITTPPATTVSDTVFRPAPAVRVTDAGGNPVAGVSVLASLFSAVDSHGKVGANLKTPQVASVLHWEPDYPVAPMATGGRLHGTTLAQTNADGIAFFTDLALFGPEGRYGIVFKDVDDELIQTPIVVIENRPKVILDHSYMSIAAIKSISGVRPANEFFELRFKLRFMHNFGLLAYTDIALSDQSADSAAAPERRIVEACFQPSFRGELDHDDLTSIAKREFLAGVTLKIFNTVPYYGIHIGGAEAGASYIAGSSLSLAYVAPFGYKQVTVDGQELRPTQSLVFDFFIRSDKIEFFKILTIRGSVLLPFKRPDETASRIAIAVPVGPLYAF